MSPEFWAAILGAVVGSVSAGIISWLLQASNNRTAAAERAAAKREHDAGLACKILFDLQQASSDLHKIHCMVVEATGKAKELNGDHAVWRALKPVANLPKPIHFDSPELALLLEHGEGQLLNDVRDVDALHHSSLQAWRAYAEKRQELKALLPGTAEGTIVTSDISGAEPHLAPALAEVADLARSICEFAERDARIADATMQAFLPVFTKFTGKGITLDGPPIAQG